MRNYWLTLGICVVLSATSCSDSVNKSRGNLQEIDVETAFKQPQELSLLDLGKDVVYIPLETVDESLIKLNSTSIMKVTEDYIFIADSRQPILCFDRKTGKFLRRIGNIGQGPQEYSDGASFLIDPIGKRIYVMLGTQRFQCYDYEGHFLETVTCVDLIQAVAAPYFFVGDKMYQHTNIANENTTALTYCYDLKSGQPIDSLLAGASDKPATARTLMMPVMGTEFFGGRNFIAQYGDVYTYGRRLNSTFWVSDGELYMKDAFCDTIFQVKDLKQRMPVVAFRMGEYGGYGRFETKEYMAGKFLIPNLQNGKDCIYFILYKGLYDFIDMVKAGKAPTGKFSCGIYNKRTGETKIQENSVNFKNPLLGMPDAVVFNVSTDGAFVLTYQADQLATAREEIPEDKQPEWLKNLKEDDNPVVLLVK